MKEKSVVEMAMSLLEVDKRLSEERDAYYMLRPFEKETYEALIDASKIIVGLVEGRIDSVPKSDKWLEKYAGEK